MLTACVMSDVYEGDDEHPSIERLPRPMGFANRLTTQSGAKQPVDIEDLDLAQIAGGMQPVPI